MTFDDDYIHFCLSTGPLRATCKELGLNWPPPERIVVVGRPLSSIVFRRIRHSQITDDERRAMTHVCRGAEYVHDTGDEAHHADQA